MKYYSTRYAQFLFSAIANKKEQDLFYFLDI